MGQPLLYSPQVSVRTASLSIKIVSCSRTLRCFGQRLLDRVGQLEQAHPHSSLGLLLLLYVLAQLGYSLAAPLWHDELFTFYIAQAPTLPAMLDQIRHVDLNPPLSYLLTRLSFRCFGVGTLQCRLPEIAGFALAMGSVHTLVKRRAGGAFGLLAASFLFASRAGELATQARPYGLMLGFASLAFACYSAACTKQQGQRSRAALFILCAALVALLLTHVFGLLAWAALVTAEAALVIRTRHLHPPRVLALLLPFLTTLLYRPLLSNHAQSAFPPSFQPTGSDIFVFYMGHIDRELITLGLSSLVLLILRGRSWLRPSAGFVLTFAEWIALGGFLGAPLLLIAYLMAAHGAFFDRYGVIACIGTAILFTVLWQWWTAGRPSAAFVAALLALLLTGRLPDAVAASAQGRIFRHTEPATEPLSTTLLADPKLPLVTASGLTFLEMQRREPASLLDRSYYLTDTEAALDFAHATIFEGMPAEVTLFHLRGHTAPYPAFLAAHPTFYVLGTYDYPEDWLLRKLQHDGARLQALGRVPGLYKDHELYEVQTRP